MSDNLTRQQLQDFLTLLLGANLSTRSWVDLWNPNTPTNRRLLNPLFNSINKELRIMLKEILQQHGAIFEQNVFMRFPVNFQHRIPQIVEEFMRRRFPQATEAVAEMPPRLPVCGGGAAAVKAFNPADDGFPSWLDRSGWSVPVPKSQQKGSGCARGGCAVSEDSDANRKSCQWGQKCKLAGTWGGCPNIHPDDNQKTGKLPERGGPTIVVCNRGSSCEYGKICWFPHPTNSSCVIEQRNTTSGPIYIARVCTLKKCNGTKCPCAHLPEDVIKKALQRKNDAFAKSSRGGGVACSAVSRSAVDCSSDMAADLEVASLTGALQGLSLEKPHCGGGAHACSLHTESGHVVEGDLLGLDLPCVVEEDRLGLESGSVVNDNQAPPASAPPLVLSSLGQWVEIVDPNTGVSYFQNMTGEVSYTPPQILEDVSCACVCEAGSSGVSNRPFDAVQPSYSCAVVRRHKVKQEDTSVAPKATKRPAGSDSGPESSKKGRQ